jgi:hypothetical protein
MEEKTRDSLYVVANSTIPELSFQCKTDTETHVDYSVGDCEDVMSLSPPVGPRSSVCVVFVIQQRLTESQA